MELVGREAQLAAVDAALDDVRDGGARVLVVTGEPGIGKTALLEAIEARASGMLVLAARAAEHEREVPFALTVGALDDHVATLHPTRVDPALGAVLPAAGEGFVPVAGAAAERFRYHRALRALIESIARERPLVLALDDVHWADDASLEFVLHLLRRPPRAPYLLVLAFRARQVPEPLLQAVSETTLVALEPLDHEQSLALVGDERIAREGHGNPLFLKQLARFPGDDLPACLMAAIALEVSRLEPCARALLEGAAVAGDPFDPELAAVGAAFAGDVTGALDALVAADFVRPTGNGRGFAFRHPIVRRAVYDAAPPAWALEAHERIAGALAARGAAPAVRAHHVERYAHVGDAAAIALLSEAAAASAETAPAAAARWYSAALELVPDVDTDRRLALRAQRALALASAGRVAEGHEELVAVLAASPACDLSLVAACAEFEKVLGLAQQAHRRLLDAYALAGPEDRPGLAMELASVASCFGRPGEVREWAEIAQTATVPALAGAAEAIGALGTLWLGDAVAACAERDRAAKRLRSLDDAALGARPDALFHLALTELLTERFTAAAASAERGLAFARRTGRGHLLVALSCVAAAAHAELLALDAAEAAVDNATDGVQLQDVTHFRELVLWSRVPIHELRGESVTRLVAEWSALVGQTQETLSTRAGQVVAACADAERDPARAISELAPLIAHGDPSFSTRPLFVLTRASVALGRVDEAQRWADRCTELAVLPAGAVRAACARAEVLLARGEAARAAAVALGAVEAAERAGARRDEVSARILAGRSLAPIDPDHAKATLRRAADDARRGGAHALVGEAARELRRLGARIPTPAPQADGPAELSERERDVSALAVQGRSNKEIAAELYLSEKTVEGTLTRVYGKLGVRSRVELTRRLSAAEQSSGGRRETGHRRRAVDHVRA